MARTVVLISCVSKKLPRMAKAEEMYISPLFRWHLRYAKSLKAHAINILSAKYGLLALSAEIDPYDLTLNDMPARQRKAWSEGVLQELKRHYDVQRDHFVFLAGERYRHFLLPCLPCHSVPFLGLPIGKLLQRLKETCS